jgi:biotin transporter BioY
MVKLLLEILSWITAAGYVVFYILYILLASPLKDKMGRGILLFMGSLMLAFVYVLSSGQLNETLRLTIWLIIIMPLLATSIWTAVVVLIKFQVEARKDLKYTKME